MIFWWYCQALKTLTEGLLALLAETRVEAIEGRERKPDPLGMRLCRLRAFLPMLNDYIRQAARIGPDLILLINFLEGKILRPDVSPTEWASRVIRITQGIVSLRCGLHSLHDQVRDGAIRDEMEVALRPLRAELALAVESSKSIATLLGLPEIYNTNWTLDESTIPGLQHLNPGHRFQAAPEIVFRMRAAAGLSGELPEHLAPLVGPARGVEDLRPPN